MNNPVWTSIHPAPYEPYPKLSRRLVHDTAIFEEEHGTLDGLGVDEVMSHTKAQFGTISRRDKANRITTTETTDKKSNYDQSEIDITEEVMNENEAYYLQGGEGGSKLEGECKLVTGKVTNSGDTFAGEYEISNADIDTPTAQGLSGREELPLEEHVPEVLIF